MFTVILFMAGGICIGYLLREKPLNIINKTIIILIWLLLFLLGIEVGSNPQIIGNLATLGLDALIITLACVLGSCITASILWKIVRNKKDSKHEK